MARGPLPDPNHRHRNVSVIPTTALPAVGRTARVPSVPKSYDLGAAGKAWWLWAWKLPQACAWSLGDVYVIARRASLEDILAVLDEAKTEMAVLREMRELDDRLGLTPKGMASLRWKIVADDVEEVAQPEGVTSLDDRRTRLTGA